MRARTRPGFAIVECLRRHSKPAIAATLEVSHVRCFQTPIGWTMALIVWAYALLWFLVNSMVKRFVLRAFKRPRPRTVAVSGNTGAVSRAP